MRRSWTMQGGFMRRLQAGLVIDAAWMPRRRSLNDRVVIASVSAGPI
jgi:hypothetical protein